MFFSDWTKETLYKIIVFAVNILFVIFGFLLILWGSVTLSRVENFESANEAARTATVPILAIVLGSTIFILAVLGAVGTITENYYITITYAAILVIVTTLQLTLVLYMFFRSETFLDGLNEAVEEAYSNNNKANGYPFDKLELNLECCGLVGYQDYGQNPPKTCCGVPRSSSTRCRREIFSKRRGCEVAFREFWLTNIHLIRWVGLLIFVVEVVIIWFAYSLIKKFRNTKTAGLGAEKQSQQSTS